MQPEQKKEIKFIAALGNPSPEYAETYHNAGRMALEWYLKNSTGGKIPKLYAYKNIFEYARLNGLIFAESLLFMNDSGVAIKTALKRFGIKPERMLLAHDDSDIEMGKIKIVFGRGSAGHNGVESVINNIGTKNFWRMRIGIREKIKKNGQRKKAGDFVMKNLTEENRKSLEEAFSRSFKDLLEKTQKPMD